jgi:hypothetical protein
MAARKRKAKVTLSPLDDELGALLQRLQQRGNEGVMVSRSTMDGLFLVCNMLLGALRRGAHTSLGINKESSAADTEDVRPLMIKLAAAGLSDVLETGLLDMDAIRLFAGDVQDELAKNRKR